MDPARYNNHKFSIVPRCTVKLKFITHYRGAPRIIYEAKFSGRGSVIIMHRKILALFNKRAPLDK